MRKKLTTQSFGSNLVLQGDNLLHMNSLASETVDLCYIDPPFFTEKNYKNILDGALSTLNWNENKRNGFFDSAAFFEKHIQTKEKGLDAYLVWMKIRLQEIYRLLKPTGSIYVHLDYHASHYVKIILDEIFGIENFQNEIVWKRKQGSNSTSTPRSLSNNSDTILFYTKSKKYTFNPIYQNYSTEYINKNYNLIDENGDRYTSENMRAPSFSPTLVYNYKGYKPHPNGWCVNLAKMKELDSLGFLIFPKSKDGRIRRKNYLKDRKGVPLTNIWDDIGCLQGKSVEKTIWPTQKPMELLERIINLSSNKNDLVLDCFAGSGTTLHAAHKLERKFVGIEISSLAIQEIKKRFLKEDINLEIKTEADIKKFEYILSAV
ncbi:MAG: site-specific DNA-methyltransferase [Pseudobdellovibrio sp.]